MSKSSYGGGGTGNGGSGADADKRWTMQCQMQRARSATWADARAGMSGEQRLKRRQAGAAAHKGPGAQCSGRQRTVPPPAPTVGRHGAAAAAADAATLPANAAKLPTPQRNGDGWLQANGNGKGLECK